MRAIYRYFASLVTTQKIDAPVVAISSSIYDYDGACKLEDSGVGKIWYCELYEAQGRERAHESSFLLCGHADLEDVAMGHEFADFANKCWPCTYVSLAHAKKSTILQWTSAFPNSTRISAFGALFLRIGSSHELRAEAFARNSLDTEKDQKEQDDWDKGPFDVTLSLDAADEGHYVLFADAANRRIALGLISEKDLARAGGLNGSLLFILRNVYPQIADLMYAEEAIEALESTHEVGQ